MATSAFLNGEVAEFTVLVDGDVMHEFIVRFRVVLSPKRSSRLFSGKTALHRRSDHSHGCLSPKDFKQVCVGDE